MIRVARIENWQFITRAHCWRAHLCVVALALAFDFAPSSASASTLASTLALALQPPSSSSSLRARNELLEAAAASKSRARGFAAKILATALAHAIERKEEANEGGRTQSGSQTTRAQEGARARRLAQMIYWPSWASRKSNSAANQLGALEWLAVRVAGQKVNEQFN